MTDLTVVTIVFICYSKPYTVFYKHVKMLNITVINVFCVMYTFFLLWRHSVDLESALTITLLSPVHTTRVHKP